MEAESEQNMPHSVRELRREKCRYTEKTAYFKIVEPVGLIAYSICIKPFVRW